MKNISEELYNKYGFCDIVSFYEKTSSYFRIRAYCDGAWLQGYLVEEVIYWGA